MPSLRRRAAVSGHGGFGADLAEKADAREAIGKDEALNLGMALVAMAGNSESVIVIDDTSDPRLGRVFTLRDGTLGPLMLVGSIAVMGNWPDIEPWAVPESMIRRRMPTPDGYERRLWRSLIYWDSGLVWRRGRWERFGNPEPLAAAGTWWDSRR